MSIRSNLFIVLFMTSFFLPSAYWFYPLLKVGYLNLQLLLLNQLFLYSILPVFFWALLLSAYVFNCMSSQQIQLVTIITGSSLSLVTIFVLISIASDISIVTPARLWLLFAQNIFLRPFTFNLSLSLNLKCLLYTAYSYILIFFQSILQNSVFQQQYLIQLFNITTYKVEFTPAKPRDLLLLLFVVVVVFCLFSDFFELILDAQDCFGASYGHLISPIFFSFLVGSLFATVVTNSASLDIQHLPLIIFYKLPQGKSCSHWASSESG